MKNNNCESDKFQDGFCGHMRGFIQPNLLLLLLKKPAHGYELMEILSKKNIAGMDPGNLYRTLRSLEKNHFVRSSWEAGDTGPSRRVYEITEQGIEYLNAWVERIRRTRSRLSDFLEDYEKTLKKSK
jgi:poly-beta-hydroxybutyrate-responsive repressor